MQCPACKSASPDDVRFCLHCGQYLGEPDETTRVYSSTHPKVEPAKSKRTILPAEWERVIDEYEEAKAEKAAGVSGLRVALIVFAVVLILCIGVIVGVNLVTEPQTQPVVKPATPMPARTPSPIIVNSVPAFSPENEASSSSPESKPSPVIEDRPTLLGSAELWSRPR